MLILLTTLCGMLGWLALSAFMSGLETAAYGASRPRLQVLAEEGNPSAQRAQTLLSNMPGLISTVLVGNNVVNYMASYTLAVSLQAAGVLSPEIWTTVVITPVFFIFGESLPKRLAYRYANAALMASARLLTGLKLLLWPVCRILEAFSELLRAALKKAGLTRPELKGKHLLAESIEASAADGVLSDAQHRMANRIMNLEKLTIGEVMLPARKAITVCEAEICQNAGERVLDMGYARALLTARDGTLTGHLITLNRMLREPDRLHQPVAALATPAMRLDTRTPVLHAINQMRRGGSRLAVAVNASGRPVGAIPFTMLLGYVTGSIRL